LAKQEGDNERSKTWLLTILRSLEEDDTRQVSVRSKSDERQFEQIRAMCYRIRHSPGVHYVIPQLAAECHCTAGHFTRRFEKYTGISPRAFIIQARIESAKSQLRMSEHKISAIAESLGYGDVFHFSKQFKEKTGYSPAEYRRG
jgi:AraC-like DNA-binding protein